ncbi:MAG: phosphatidylglycerol lysyltransferase domain-containing protein, partial [Pseudomonadota bacterium]
EVPLSAWVAALTLAAVSFSAIGAYDAIWHRIHKTGVSDRRAMLTGASAIAISQTTGFGLLVAGAIRWHMFPKLRGRAVAALSVCVSIGFIICWVILSLFVFMALPSEAGPTQGLATLGVATTIIFCLVIVLSPAVQVRLWRKLPRHMPSLRASGALLLAGLIDLVAAAACFAMLVPDLPASALVTLVPAFILATGLGLLGNTPAGIGPFELTLLAALPHVPASDLAVAFLGYRIVYHLIPAALGLLFLLCADGRRGNHQMPRVEPAYDPKKGNFAEAGLVYQGQLSWLPTPRGDIHIASGETANTIFTVGMPSQGRIEDVLTILANQAAKSYRGALAYKLDKRAASMARSRRWHVRKAAQEAVLDPQTFTLDGRSKSTLRRKLRQAEKANIEIETRWFQRPTQAMHEIARAWACQNGGERGLTTGRFAPEYISQQLTIVAHTAQTQTAFITLHLSKNEWTLDLMRSSPDAPAGTLYALVVAALQTAREHGISRLSLAAVPAQKEAENLFERMSHKRMERIGCAGLRQFKSTFDPKWETLYAAGSHPAALLIGGWEMSQLAQNPPPLAGRSRSIAVAMILRRGLAFEGDQSEGFVAKS